VLLDKGNKVILGVTPLTELVLGQAFPQLQKINLPPYEIRYSLVLPIWLKLVFDLPRLRAVIKKEHQLLNEIVLKNNIDVVVSDNRYGLYHPNTKNIIVCHQINLITPFFSTFANMIHKKWLSKFSEVWVPDHQNRSKALAGKLSDNKWKLNCKYIGPLSRLIKLNSEQKYDQLFLLSGPDPQHSDLLNKVLALAKNNHSKKIAVVTSKKTEAVNGADVFQLPDNKKLSELIASSKQINCRSGYSTLMDMHLLNKKDLVLIPTKGQTEQEYLAEHWKTHFNAIILNEDKLNNYNL
jgi:hypothetical protein